MIEWILSSLSLPWLIRACSLHANAAPLFNKSSSETTGLATQPGGYCLSTSVTLAIYRNLSHSLPVSLPCYASPYISQPWSPATYLNLALPLYILQPRSLALSLSFYLYQDDSRLSMYFSLSLSLSFPLTHTLSLPLLFFLIYNSISLIHFYSLSLVHLTSYSVHPRQCTMLRSFPLSSPFLISSPFAPHLFPVIPLSLPPSLCPSDDIIQNNPRWKVSVSQ